MMSYQLEKGSPSHIADSTGVILEGVYTCKEFVSRIMVTMLNFSHANISNHQGNESSYNSI